MAASHLRLLFHRALARSTSKTLISTTYPFLLPNLQKVPPWRQRWGTRGYAHGIVSLVIREGKPKFEVREVEPPKKAKWLNKKRFKKKRMKEKLRRKEANKRDPRRLRPRGPQRCSRFATPEERLKYKIHKAKRKEALLVERLKVYEVQKVQGPMIKPESLTGEERFYMKKMAQKRSNYVPVGRRGVFGGVILNMHLHWKKHETVEVICKPCKPGQINEYAKEIARLSGGIPIQVIGDNTIIFYRGRNYVQPEVMSPIDTLSKKKALEKSKYEQSLETVRHFIAISEKELELYYRHTALYGNPSCRSADVLHSFGKKYSKAGSEPLHDGEDSKHGNHSSNDYKYDVDPTENDSKGSDENDRNGSDENNSNGSDENDSNGSDDDTQTVKLDCGHLSEVAFGLDTGEREKSIRSIHRDFERNLSDSEIDLDDSEYGEYMSESEQSD